MDLEIIKLAQAHIIKPATLICRCGMSKLEHIDEENKKRKQLIGLMEYLMLQKIT